MPKLILIDVEKCVGCRTCEMVCSLSHTGEVDPRRSRIKVVRWEHEGHFIPLNCRHCDTAPCEAICPRQAIVHTDAPPGVSIDSNKCIGCRTCLQVCPFGAIAFDGVEKKMVKCDLCQGDPVCVKFCAYDAINYIDSAELHRNRQFSAAAGLLELLFCTDRPGSTESDDQETK